MHYSPKSRELPTAMTGRNGPGDFTCHVLFSNLEPHSVDSFRQQTPHYNTHCCHKSRHRFPQSTCRCASHSANKQCLVLNSTTRRQMRHLKRKRQSKHCLAVPVYSTVNITAGSNCQRTLTKRSPHDQICTCRTIRITFKTSNNDSVETAQDSGGANAHTEVLKIGLQQHSIRQGIHCMYVCMCVCMYIAPSRRVRVTIVAVQKQQLTNS